MSIELIVLGIVFLVFMGVSSLFLTALRYGRNN